MPASTAGLRRLPPRDLCGMASLAFFLATPFPTFHVSQPRTAFRLLTMLMAPPFVGRRLPHVPRRRGSGGNAAFRRPLTPLAARCSALGASPYFDVLSSRLGLASLASGARGTCGPLRLLRRPCASVGGEWHGRARRGP